MNQPNREVAIGCTSVAPGIVAVESGTLHFSAAALARANRDGLVDREALAALIGRLVTTAFDAEDRNAA